MTISVPEPDLGGIPPPEVLKLIATDGPAKTSALAPAVRFPEPFKCRISWVADAAIVEVGGEIDIATAPALENAITSIQESAARVVVDLSQVSFLDSAALKVLTHSQSRLGDRDALRVVLPTDHSIRKLFEITELIEPLGVVDSIDAALGKR
jgi:anti-sigma B factor antagonist